MKLILATIFIFLAFGTSMQVSASSCTPVNGGWSEWSGCNEKCFMQRLCNKPAPLCGGTRCSGAAIVSCSGGACSKCGDNYCSPSETFEGCPQDCENKPTETPTPTQTGSGTTSTGTDTIPTGTGAVITPGEDNEGQTIFTNNPVLLVISLFMIFSVATINMIIFGILALRNKLRFEVRRDRN